MSNSWEFGLTFPHWLRGIFLSLSFSPLLPLFSPTVLERALESLEYLKAFLLLTAIND